MGSYFKLNVLLSYILIINSTNIRQSHIVLFWLHVYWLLNMFPKKNRMNRTNIRRVEHKIVHQFTFWAFPVFLSLKPYYIHEYLSDSYCSFCDAFIVLADPFEKKTIWIGQIFVELMSKMLNKCSHSIFTIKNIIGFLQKFVNNIPLFVYLISIYKMYVQNRTT